MYSTLNFRFILHCLFSHAKGRIRYYKGTNEKKNDKHYGKMKEMKEVEMKQMQSSLSSKLLY